MEIDLQELWTEFESGTQLTKLAKKHNVTRKTLCHRLRQVNEDKYKEIRDANWRKARRQVPIREILRRLENGESVKGLAKEYACGRYALSNKLRHIDEMKYKKLADRNRRKKKKQIDIGAAWTSLETGVSVRRTAEKHGITARTLRQILVRNDSQRYSQAIRARSSSRTGPGSKIGPEILREFENGMSINELSRNHRISRRTLQVGLATIYENRYKELTRARQVGFGSPKARLEGADSILETEVKKMLEKNCIPHSFHRKLVVEGHRYVPDFSIGDHTIIEVTSMTTEKYWGRTTEKLRRYINNGFRVILVTERRRLKHINHYLPKSSDRFVVIEYEDLRSDFVRFLGIITGGERT